MKDARLVLHRHIETDVPVGQMRRLLSQLALANKIPSGLTAKLVIASICSLHISPPIIMDKPLFQIPHMQSSFHEAILMVD